MMRASTGGNGSLGSTGLDGNAGPGGQGTQAAPSRQLIVCEGMVKIYKTSEVDVEVVALQGLDLHVAPGELMALVGASGSGKSTLLNILGGLDRPTAGRCEVAGWDLARMDERDLTQYRRTVIGHVWQQPGRNLLPDLSVRENIEFPLVVAGEGSRRRAARAGELLEMVGMVDQARARPTQLSGGEQQRAAIAVALANNPAILLADEPTGELDSRTAAAVFNALRLLNRQLGITIIVVTHDQSIASAVDRTIAIRDGRTSTETVRWANMAGGDAGSYAPGAPVATESVLIDRTGHLQLPAAVLHTIQFNGRAEVRVVNGHVELWPAARPDTRSAGANPYTQSAPPPGPMGGSAPNSGPGPMAGPYAPAPLSAPIPGPISGGRASGPASGGAPGPGSGAAPPHPALPNPARANPWQ
ncbi:MAG TPA: ABC transporter ATP-binding protein [Ktedonobacterales bacterium]